MGLYGVRFTAPAALPVVIVVVMRVPEENLEGDVENEPPRVKELAWTPER
jgi:hypothetical protein